MQQERVNEAIEYLSKAKENGFDIEKNLNKAGMLETYHKYAQEQPIKVEGKQTDKGSLRDLGQQLSQSGVSVKEVDASYNDGPNDPHLNTLKHRVKTVEEISNSYKDNKDKGGITR